MLSVIEHKNWIYLIVSCFIIKSTDCDDIPIKGCGERKYFEKKIGNLHSSGRIVGGRDAVMGEFPWMVSIKNKKGHYKCCGGAILNSRWIITAAHCVWDKRAKDLEVTVGALDFTETTPFQRKINVEKVIPHLLYSTITTANDIALIKTTESIAFSPNNTINGICLPFQNQFFGGYATVSGWGKIAEFGDPSFKLKAADVVLIPRLACQIFYPQRRLIDGMVCAGSLSPEEGPCSGDSGGALVKLNRDGTSTLVGLVSWGVGCARLLTPTVFTQVSRYMRWIYSHVF